ncbi:MAG TPA: polysaccharide biosynthesis/export family protein [Verrucomicrobiae bacterium]|nr:polysaccharide biosynthesis/export family protein [Verrucomicrobiae bacterium]
MRCRILPVCFCRLLLCATGVCFRLTAAGADATTTAGGTNAVRIIEPLSEDSSHAGTNVVAPGLASESIAYARQLAAKAATNGASSSTNPPSENLNATNAAASALEALDDKVKLGLGDRVSFRVVEDRDDPKSLVVADSGELEAPYIGRVAASGKTCRQLAREIKKELEKKYYYQATVIIGLDLLNKTRGKVYIAGRVRIPGYQDIPTDEVFSVSKAILRAGGFTDFADKKHVKVTHKKTASDAKDESSEIVDVSAVLEKGETGKDMVLRPDDLIFVPARMVNF